MLLKSEIVLTITAMLQDYDSLDCCELATLI
jgi:hypothetical protein